MADVKVVEYVLPSASGKPVKDYVALVDGSLVRGRTLAELAGQLRGVDVTGLHTYGLSGPEMLELYGTLKKDTNARS